MKWSNAVTDLLQTGYPIIQAPMFGVSTPEMVAAAAKARCLGSLPLGDMSAGKCAELIRKTRQQTDQPFAVNIFVNPVPEITEELRVKYQATRQYLEDLALSHGLRVRLPDIESIRPGGYHEQVEVLIEEQCPVVSFTFGNIDDVTIGKLKDNHTVLIGTCTSVEEAVILEKSGIDMLCVQGLEAGGHRGSFDDRNIPQIGGLSLLSNIRDTVKAPLIYGGGISDAKTLLAVKAVGAQGFQVGSMLLAARESTLKPFEKNRLRQAKEEEILLTRSFSGRTARGIRNLFIEVIEQSDYILPYPYQNKLTSELRKAAKEKDNADFVSIWVGQSHYRFSEESTTDILLQLIRDVEATVV